MANILLLCRTDMLFIPGDQGEFGESCIERLLDAMDKYFELPQRDTNSPAIMPIDNIISVPGRGTVAIGRHCIASKFSYCQSQQASLALILE